MSCEEAKKLLPRHLSGELEAEERRAFQEHVSTCAACSALVESSAEADERLRAALLRDAPDAKSIEDAVRQSIAAQERQRLYALAAAVAAIFVLTASLGLHFFGRIAQERLMAAAERDHRAEIVEQQSRRWSTSYDQIAALVEQAGFSYETATRLAPQGYALARAKYCGLNGERALHLVFSNGAHTYSLYVRPGAGLPRGVESTTAESETAATVSTWRATAVVVSESPEADCARLARFAAARL